MPMLHEVLASLYGAWRLGHFDSRGMAYFNASTQGAWRSFFAAIIVGPPFAIMLALRYSTMPAGTNVARFVLAEGIAYVMSWVAYPVLMASVTRILGCDHRFKRYIVAYNWSLVLQNALFLPIGMLSAAGILPFQAADFLWLAALTLVLAYLWFIARAALEVPAFTAAGVVVLDIMLSLVIDGAADGMY